MNYTNINNNNITHLEVCSGAGGLTLGFERAEKELEIKSRKILLELMTPQINTLKLNNNKERNWTIVQEDLTKFKFDNPVESWWFAEKYNIKELDILSGGIPCQSFSIAGKQRGFECQEKGVLFFHYMSLVRDYKPKIAMIENVKNLVRINNGREFNIILSYFKHYGYTVYHKVMNANDYGVAQNRERIIIVAIRNDIAQGKKSFSFIEPFNQGRTFRDEMDRMKRNINKGGWFDFEYPSMKKKLELCRRVRNKEKPKTDYEKRYYTEYKKRFSKDLYDKPYYTLMTAPDNNLTFCPHPNLKRVLSLNEYAVIQDYPDDYKFWYENEGQAYEQIGNSVPIGLGYAVAKSIYKYLYNIED